MTRPVDKKATKIARAAHQRGVDRLQDLFGVYEDDVAPRVREVVLRGAEFGDSSGRGTPVRLRPNTPPVRDAEHQLKHKKRKLVRESRKRNRS